MYIEDWERLRSTIDDEVLDVLFSASSCGPFDGCCLVVAQALREVIGGDLVVLVRANNGSAEHAALLYDSRLWDFDGPLPPSEFIARFETNEMPGSGEKCGGYRTFEVADLPDAIRDPALVSVVADIFRGAFSEFVTTPKP